jgi:hypothetical protein
MGGKKFKMHKQFSQKMQKATPAHCDNKPLSTVDVFHAQELTLE